MRTLVLSVLVLVACVAFTSAQPAQEVDRRRGGGRRPGRRPTNDEGCSEWMLSECVPRSGTCGRGFQQGQRTGDTCIKKEKRFKCRMACDGDTPGRVGRPGSRKCTYNKKGAVKGDCDTATNTRTITLPLKGGPATCEATKVITRPCRNTRGRKTSGRRGQNACRYQRAEWSECDTTTNTMTRNLTLKKGDPNVCEATKSVTKRCKKEKCSYGPWSEFGACQNGVKTKTREVISGGEKCQNRTSKTKPCRN